MPRSTAKSKAKNGNKAKSFDAPKNTKKQKNDVKKDKESVADKPKEIVVEEVFHRKSERRRIARDIFLVFEEESKCRRKTRANKIQAKPKFGHLKVDDNNRKKGLLKDIKNEPKCYLNDSSVSVNATLATEVPILRTNSNTVTVKKKEDKKSKKPICKTVNSDSNKLNNTNSASVSKLESQPCTVSNENKLVAKINPIFLWVKQDDTRIVEVRCEDYDKRNRIRITKTSNGWRAIPRSDPSTSRVLKLYSTPLMKVKKENNINELKSTINNNNKNESNETETCKKFFAQNILSESAANNIQTKLNGIDTVCNPLAIQSVKNKNKTKYKKSKKIKKKPRTEKALTKSTISATAENITIVNKEPLITELSLPSTKNSLEILDFPIQQTIIEVKTIINKKEEERSEDNLYATDLIQSVHTDAFENDGEDLDTNVNSVNPSSPHAVTSDEKSAYQKESEKEFPFHLCSKTGLFLPNNLPFSVFENESNKNIVDQNALSPAKNCFLSTTENEIGISIDKINVESKLPISDENTESLEAKTKNLKDLLDDADLLQNCDDNANSDADLIDTLVKTSCENNLIQANETDKTADELHEESLNETNEMVVQLIADVSNPPKCLSFNEAGEIEGLNGELFQSNTYIENFDKHSFNSLTEAQITSVAEITAPSQKISSCENIEPMMGIDVNNIKLQSVNEIDDSPKDLSYKKREEVCPPSESRSQCAVTSSSDVIKSPQIEEPSSLTSSSETLKNLILEQFMKLNTLTTTHHQRESKEIEKQRHTDVTNLKSMYSFKPTPSSNFIETVIIEDDDENNSDIEHEEPQKKRLRLKPTILNQNVSKLAMIDKDPDPLTQLRLLIRNTQWKVPDPILVPKDRLSAVLASPAREIPLLITTRPELRLPEAFAYPEIIQNPNILVISMAQLETILKNEVEKSATFKAIETDVEQQTYDERLDCQMANPYKTLQTQSTVQHHQLASKQPKNILTTNTIPDQNNISHNHTDISDPISERRQEYEKISQTDSSHSSDINAATMAVLNQMLWLPYFGQMSQDMGKGIKKPLGLQEKCANIPPFFNTMLNGTTNLEETTTTNKMPNAPYNAGLQNFQQQFKTNEELLLFQKIVQHQVQSVLQLNQLKSDSSQIKTPAVVGNTVSSIEKSKLEPLANLNEQRKQKVVLTNKQKNTSVSKNQTINCDNNVSVLEKSYNLRSSVAGRHINESKQYSSVSQRQISDSKPRLTCKSLSNLLEPEHNMIPSSSSSIPYIQNLSSDFLKGVNDIKRNSTECNVNDSVAENIGKFVGNTSLVSPSPRSCSNVNVNMETNSRLAKKRDKTYDNNVSTNDAPVQTAETNTSLWHPLFGSNTKTPYSSPWQWTTVTATGE